MTHMMWFVQNKIKTSRKGKIDLHVQILSWNKGEIQASCL
jgi:hypothetical protein